MSDRLCEMLVRQGELSPEEAEAAEARQVQMGGALDSALLERGVDPQRLRMAMAQAYETPVAQPEDVSAEPEPRALRAFPEQWARRHQLLPLRLEESGRVLTVLSPAPADLALLLRLGELLELQLQPRIALELDVLRGLSRVYGRPMAPRFAELEPGARSWDALPFRQAKARLAVADSRDEVARTLLAFASRHVEYGALLVRQGDRLRGWMQTGPRPDGLGLNAPLSDFPTALRAIEAPSLQLNPMEEDVLAERLGRAPGRTTVLAPLRIRDRTVALMFADNGPRPVPSAFVEDLGLLMTSAQQSLEALLLRRKAETLSQLGRAEAAGEASEPTPDVAPEVVSPAPDARTEPRADISFEPTEAVTLEAAELEPGWTQATPTGGTSDEDDTDHGALPIPDVAEPEDFELSIEEPTLAPEPESELPDEPIYGSEDEDWEPVAVARANHAQGYELVAPRSRERLDSDARPVATAPTSSRDLPAFEPPSEAPLRAAAPSSVAPDPSASLETWSDRTPWPDESDAADFASAEDWPPRPSAEWSDADFGDAQDSEPVLLVDQLKVPPSAERAPEASKPSIDLSEDDTMDWVRQLDSERPAQAREAREVLLERGRRSLPALLEAFPGRLEVDPFGRRELPSFEGCGPLLELISRFGREAHDGVALKLDGRPPSVRFFATYFYSSVFVPEIIPRLIQRLHDGEPRICMVAARTLFGYRDHPDFNLVLEHLHGRMQAESPAARRHAVYLIGLFRDVTAIPALIDRIEARDRFVSDVAVDALAEITKQNFGTAARRWRQWLAKNGQRSRIEWLIEGLSAREPALRRSAGEELRAVSGEDFGFEPDGSKRRREEAKARYIEWWSRQGDYQSSFEPSPGSSSSSSSSSSVDGSSSSSPS